MNTVKGDTIFYSGKLAKILTIMPANNVIKEPSFYVEMVDNPGEYHICCVSETTTTHLSNSVT